MLIIVKKKENLKKDIGDGDEIINIVNEIEKDDRDIEDLTKDYPDKIKKLEEALD